MSTTLTTATGRIVWSEGDPLVIHALTDHMNRPKMDQKTGQQAQGIEFGLAIPKADFGPIWEAMAAEAQAGFPGREYLDPATGNWKTFNDKNGFAWKVKDGDIDPVGVDQQGQPRKNPDYYRGHFILTCATRYPVPISRVADVVGQKSYVQISDPTEIKRGHKVRVQIEIAPNGNQGDTAGLYVNPKQVLLIDASENLVLSGAGGGNPGAAFGDAGQYQTVAAPQGSAPGGMHGQMPGNAAPQGTQANMPPGGMPGNGAQMPSNNGQTAPQDAYPSNAPGGMPGFTQPPANAGHVAGSPPNGAPAQAPGLNANAGTGYPSNSAAHGMPGNVGYAPNYDFANPQGHQGGTPGYPGQH